MSALAEALIAAQAELPTAPKRKPPEPFYARESDSG